MHIRSLELRKAWTFPPFGLPLHPIQINQEPVCIASSGSPRGPWEAAIRGKDRWGAGNVQDLTALWLLVVLLWPLVLPHKLPVSELGIDDLTRTLRSHRDRPTQCPGLEPPQLTMAGPRWASIYIIFLYFFAVFSLVLFVCKKSLKLPLVDF